MKKILFVCTGNTCRSSMAKGLLEHSIKMDPDLDKIISVDSSGIYAIPGDNASVNSILALKEDYKIDISSHKAKGFDYETGSASDLILTMTGSHKAEILRKYPEFSAKTFTLKEFTNSNSIKPVYGTDITDPYGGTLEAYKLCAEEIHSSIKELIQMIKKDKGL